MSILFVTGIEGARNCADVVGKLLDMEVVIAEGRKGALALLRQREFAAVVVDDTVAACDPAAAEVRSGSAGARDPRRPSPPATRAGTGAPCGRRSRRIGGEDNFGRPAPAVAAGPVEQRRRLAVGGEAPGRSQPGRRSSPSVVGKQLLATRC